MNFTSTALQNKYLIWKNCPYISVLNGGTSAKRPKHRCLEINSLLKQTSLGQSTLDHLSIFKWDGVRVLSDGSFFYDSFRSQNN